MNNNFIPYIKTLNIKKSDKKTDKYMNKLIELLIFNIVSIGAIYALINNKKMIEKKYIKLIDEFICEKINLNKSFKGGNGTGMPSEYYGIDSNRYKIENEGKDLLKIDFEKGIARPQIGGNNIDFYIRLYISKIIYFYDMKISNSCKDLLLNLIKKIINNMVNDEINRRSNPSLVNLVIRSYIKKLI